MKIVKIFKVDVGFVTFFISLFFFAGMLSLFYFQIKYFNDRYGLLLNLGIDLGLIILLSIILANFSLQFIKEKILLICEIINKNNYDLVDKYFPQNIYHIANIELSYMVNSVCEKFEKQKNENEFFNKKIVGIMETIDSISSNTKKGIKKIFQTFKALDINNDNINKLKDEINWIRENLSIIKIEKYSLKNSADEIDDIQNKMSSIFQRIETFMRNIESTKQEEEFNIELITSLKNSFKNFYDIIDDIELIAVNSSIEASRIEEAQSFLIFAKDLQLSVSKLSNEIQIITDKFQKFQIKESDLDNIILLIQELKEEYKNLKLSVDNLTQNLEAVITEQNEYAKVVSGIEEKSEEAEDLLKGIDFKTTQSFKTNVETINNNMDTLESIYTDIIEIKKRR